MQTKSDIVREYLDKFPKISTHAAARVIYSDGDNQKLWPNEEACRQSVRYVRGGHGAQHRHQCSDKSSFRPRQSDSGFEALPKPRVEIEDTSAFYINGPAKVLILGDVHIPYYDATSLKLAIEYGRKRDANVILLNGDFADCFAVSFWQKDPRERDWVGEKKACREFLAYLRKTFPKARIVYKIGNHEERIENYLQRKAPEIYGDSDFEIPALYQLDQHGVELVKDMRLVRIGKLAAIHGHEYRFAISNPVNPARGLFLRGKSNCLCNHLHQTSQHSEPNLDGKLVSCWSVGCLCNLSPRYCPKPYNKWNHGFAFVEVDKAGVFRVQNLRIIDGGIYE